MPAKNFEAYIIETEHKIITLDDYAKSPATAFLKFVVSAKDAANQCLLKFKTTSRSRTYTHDALDSIYLINAGLLASIMGNFETFQKYLFANMFEYSVYLSKFDVKDFLKDLKKAVKADNSTKFEVDFVRVAGYRDSSVPVGLILADQLSNWQSPSIVNAFFRSFRLEDAAHHKVDIYSNDSKEKLSVLWQMRHSIVHTASTITLPDAQKVPSLNGLGGKVISLDRLFINEVARKLHPIIKSATDQMKSVYIHNLKPTTPAEIRLKIEELFKVSSTCSAWLR